MATSTFEKEIYLREKAADILAEDLENNEVVKDKEAKHLKVIALNQLIKEANNEQTFAKILNFKNSIKDIEYFIKHKAVEKEMDDISRTFLVFNNSGDILGYYTLTVICLFFDEKISKERRKQIYGITDDVDSMPVMTIAQFGVNIDFEEQINRRTLLDLAVSMLKEAQSMIGGNFCLIEIVPEDKNAVEICLQSDFKVLQTDSSDGCLLMYMKL